MVEPSANVLLYVTYLTISDKRILLEFHPAPNEKKLQHSHGKIFAQYTEKKIPVNEDVTLS